MSVPKRDPRWQQLLLIAGATIAVTWTAAAATAWGSGPAEGFSTARAGLSAASGAGTVLGGFTSQRWPVVIMMSRDRSHITRVGIGLEMRCTSGMRFGTEDGWSAVPVGSGGKVRVSAKIPPSPGSGVSLVGGSDLFAGTLSHASTAFSGVWHLHLVFRTSDGHADTCDSGRVSLTAIA
jgi:hypothetical protein